MVAVGEISRESMTAAQLARIKRTHCTRKYPFMSKADADAEVARLAAAHGPLATLTLRTYGPCFFCGAYHVGHSRFRFGKRSLRRKNIMEKRAARAVAPPRPKDTPRRRAERALGAMRRKAGAWRA